MRRRQRRLRQWLRHERLSVAMALAETSHHAATRGQTKARAGVRPGVLDDPEPRRETEHEQHAALRGLKPPSPGVPSLATPLLAGQATEELDASTLAFLTRAVLEEKKKAEAEKAAKEKVKEERRRRQRRQALEQEFLALLNIPAAHRSAQQAVRLNELVELDEAEAAAASSSSQQGRRKRKKKRKKKLPKTSSLKSGHSSSSSSWYVYSGGVMSSVACGFSILGIHWLLQHSANTVLDCAYSWYSGVKVATFIRTWWSTRVVLPSMLAVFAGYDAPRAVFPSIVALADEARGDSTGAVLVPGVLPVVISSGAFDHTAKKTVEIPQLPFLTRSCTFPVVVQRLLT